MTELDPEIMYEISAAHGFSSRPFGGGDRCTCGADLGIPGASGWMSMREHIISEYKEYIDSLSEPMVDLSDVENLAIELYAARNTASGLATTPWKATSDFNRDFYREMANALIDGGYKSSRTEYSLVDPTDPGVLRVTEDLPTAQAAHSSGFTVKRRRISEWKSTGWL